MYTHVLRTDVIGNKRNACSGSVTLFLECAVYFFFEDETSTFIHTPYLSSQPFEFMISALCL
jgi:hypothetical protein